MNTYTVQNVPACFLADHMCDNTPYLLDLLAEEAADPGLYYPEVVAMCALVVDGRQARKRAARALCPEQAARELAHAEKCEESALDLLIAYMALPPGRWAVSQAKPERPALAWGVASYVNGGALA